MSTVSESMRIGASRERVFEAFVSEIDRWWPRQGTYRYTFAPDGEAPGRLVFEGQEGGRFYERFEDGSQYLIGQVTVWEPPQRLHFTWQGPNWPAHTVVEVQFREAGGETEVIVAQRGFGQRGVPDWSKNYATGWEEILASFGEWVMALPSNH